jgi:hypothetical protein
VVNREVRGLKRGHVSPATPASLTPVEPGESFSVKISPAMWKLIAAGLGAGGGLLLPKVAEWLGKLGSS